jgi:hypothetical protein
MQKHLLRKLVAGAAATVLLPTFAFAPAANAATPDLSGFVPDFTAPIPFLAEGQSATVSGVVVTATSNTAVPGDSGNTYLHQSNTRIRTVLTFDKPIPGFKAQTRLHADCLETIPVVDECFEEYLLVGKDAEDNVVFETSIEQTNDEFSFVPGSGPGELSGLIATLEIDYLHDTPIGDFLRGTYLDLWLTKTSLSPTPQTVTGKPGSPITSTVAFDATGFTGAVTYKVTGGKLPAGLVLDPATGVISGTPTETSAETVTITATGATTGVATATITFNITEPGSDDGNVSGSAGGNDVTAAVTQPRFTG